MPTTAAESTFQHAECQGIVDRGEQFVLVESKAFPFMPSRFVRNPFCSKSKPRFGRAMNSIFKNRFGHYGVWVTVFLLTIAQVKSCVGTITEIPIGGDARTTAISSQFAFPESVNRIIDTFEKTNSKIEVLDFKLTLIRIPESSLFRQRRVHYSQVGSMVRLTANEDRFDRKKNEWVPTFKDYLNDGEMEFSVDANDVRLLGVIRKDVHGLNDCLVSAAPRFDQYHEVFPELCLRFGVFDERILTLRELVASAVSIEHFERGKLLGFEGEMLVLKFGAEMVRKNFPNQISMVLSPNHGMLPIAVEEIRTIDGVSHIRERTVSEFATLSNIPFPLQVKGKAINVKASGEQNAYAFYEFRVVDLAINSGVETERFAFQFPPNSFVYHTSHRRQGSAVKMINRTDLTGADGSIVRSFRTVVELQDYLVSIFAGSARGASGIDAVNPSKILGEPISETGISKSFENIPETNSNANNRERWLWCVAFSMLGMLALLAVFRHCSDKKKAGRS